MRRIVAISAIAFVADQASKELALWRLAHRSFSVIPDIFDFVLVHNQGAAWGVLSGRRILLATISLVMLAFLAFNRKDLVKNGLSRWAGGLLVGGIVGNLFDRVFRSGGAVVDFIDWHWRDVYHWPTFNLADSFICIGVGLLLLSSVLCRKEKT